MQLLPGSRVAIAHGDGKGWRPQIGRNARAVLQVVLEILPAHLDDLFVAQQSEFLDQTCAQQRSCHWIAGLWLEGERIESGSQNSPRIAPELFLLPCAGKKVID